MTRGIDERIARAVEVAADHVMSEQLPPPPTLSPREACNEVAIGMSRFYRVFGSAEEFRRQVAIEHLRVVLDGFAEFVLDWADISEWPDGPDPLSDEELWAGIRGWTRDLWVTIGEALARYDAPPSIEAEYLPWSTDPAVCDAIADSFRLDRDRYRLAVERTIAESRRRPAESIEHLIDRFTFSSVAALMVGGADDASREAIAELHGASATVLYTIDEDEDEPGAPVSDGP